ncbi:hypothetical protein Gasu2_47460 [Galdieria sulphuraria]|uniref:SAP domain-containing protein n=1 Tax=Galdieria sulphuraria TaxID=130081 RepID=M2Y6V1_GALSU|nr:uncharacterized protein Gasu_11380 [Galdieria sulphuraria]EME31763.1 hypothetical protein Gasu_11380 [Galdieria sulphuraria]GJD10563.1 hypothetical protein Gasu2_47460 [Galdieria sulphuraria]|eukprot:XP_005708283.1 hypothetical protein Gasu_11380 [Galdieria sulphuraria]
MEPSKLKVEELRKELRSRNLDTTGLKQALVERLEKALTEERKRDNVRAAQPDTSSEVNEPHKQRELEINSGVVDNSIGRLPTDEELTALEEKRRKRAERFGVPYVPSKEFLEHKKLSRARRFGEELVEPEDSSKIEEKKRKRAERFGLSSQAVPDKLSKQVTQINQTLQTAKNSQKHIL